MCVVFIHFLERGEKKSVFPDLKQLFERFCLSLQKNKSRQKVERFELIAKLKNEHCFWSFDEQSIKDVPDDILIEKTMIYLDLPEIDALFSLFSFKKIKKVWLEYLVPQGDYLYTLNRFFAWYYFHAKHPDQYVKSMATRHYNKMFS